VEYFSRVTITIKESKHANKFGKLILSDGSVFDGMGFGYSGLTFGEIVFNTGMVGYTETLTDPSYSGQIVTLTYPLIGNYGVPDPTLEMDGLPKFFESDKIQARGLVVHELSLAASHWNLTMTLDEWLYKEKIQGISGIDTRELTKKLRESGVNLVSTKKVEKFGNESENIVLIDTGAKNAIIRNIHDIGYNTVKVPWNTSIEEILKHEPKGVVISNGPGDPENCPETISTAKSLIQKNIPTLGICLGAQILAAAGGAQTYKLKYGHRGQNKPCVNLDNNQVYVTSQNHGYCINPDSLGDTEFDLWFSNVDDKTVEGIKHQNKKCIAVQFHPEASPGPYDCKFVFDELKNIMEEGKAGKT